MHPPSTTSDVPIWKCSWCKVRNGKLTEIEIETLKNFVRLFGWPVLPLIFHDDGYVYAYGELPTLRKAETGLRWKDGNVSVLRECNASNSRVGPPEKSGTLWPGIEVTPRSGRVARVIKKHDEYLKKRGWYDLITATFDENWIDDDLDGSDTEI